MGDRMWNDGNLIVLCTIEVWVAVDNYVVLSVAGSEWSLSFLFLSVSFTSGPVPAATEAVVWTYCIIFLLR